MSENKNDALILADGSTSSSNNSNSTNNIIIQNSTKNQGNTGKSSGKKDQEHKMLLAAAKVRSLAIKCYDEQLPSGWQAVQRVIKDTDVKEFHIIAIRHYRDLKEDVDSPFIESYIKPHYHIIMRCADSSKTIRVRTFMRQLGVYFRPGIDDELWKKRGVETVDDYGKYLLYLTHEDDKSIKAGKEIYDRGELVSNLTPAELDQVRDGYFRLAKGKRKASNDDMADLDEQAYKLGYDLKNFQAWYDNLSFAERSNSKMRVVRESYERGVSKRIEDNPEVLRLCVFIKGAHNSGKTYSSRQALAGYRIKTIEGGGTGKFDDLKPDHDAIIVSDDTCPNLLNVCDNYICRVYRRQRDNPAWTGRFFIVTSNLEFDEWLEECGIKQKRHFDAMHSRFFVCEIRKDKDGRSYLALVSPSTRGSKEEQQERAGMFMDFQSKFNQSIANYRPSEDMIDFDAMIDPAHLTPDKIAHSHIEYTFGALGDFSAWFWDRAFRNNPDATYEEKVDYLKSLTDDEIRKEANQYKEYAVLSYFTVKALRASLENYARDYAIDDFDMEPWIEQEPVNDDSTT